VKRVYWVTSPEYDVYIDYFPEFGSGPRGTTEDWLEVEASSKREAVSIAVKQWLAERRERYALDDNWSSSRKADGLCPFTGVRAEIAACPHGTEMPLGFYGDGWEDQHDEWWCDQCRADWLNDVAA
jgi:hypothetical protein